MPEVTWLTAFLDVPADRWDTALRFWPEVTSTSLSSFRGPDAQFTTLVPAEGDPRDAQEIDSRQVFRRLAGCWT